MEDLKKVLISDPLSNKGIEILGRAKGLKVEIHTGLSPEDEGRGDPDQMRRTVFMVG